MTRRLDDSTAHGCRRPRRSRWSGAHLRPVSRAVWLLARAATARRVACRPRSIKIVARTVEQSAGALHGSLPVFHHRPRGRQRLGRQSVSVVARGLNMQQHPCVDRDADQRGDARGTTRATAESSRELF
jgi:hypothetical protein